MKSWHALPDMLLKPAGSLTAETVARGIDDFRGAASYLQSLPYGRTVSRVDFRAIFREGKGTAVQNMPISRHLLASKTSPWPSCWVSMTCTAVTPQGWAVD
jgi:hypothetical protein